MTEYSWYVWLVFNVFILAMLAIDLGVFHRKPHAITIKASLIWTAVWVVLGLLFGVGVWYYQGSESGLEYLTGYLIEKSLSVDNIFVFLIIFQYFHVSAKHQHTVLFWGILGALVMRAIFIFAGVALITKFAWVQYILGAFLIFTAIRTAISTEQRVHPQNNPVLKLARKIMPVTDDYRDGHFIVRESGKWMATPLLMVLLVVETTDLIFAVDSIPAILAITKEPFIVYSSNAFAILGLRALYFALAGLMERLRYLHYGLAAVLGFVGVKMLIETWVHIPVFVSLGVVAGLLTISVVASLAIKGVDEKPAAQDDTADEGLSER